MFDADRLPFRVAALARIIVLVALTGPVLWSRDAAALLAVVVIGAIWALATIVDLRRVLPVAVLTTAEAVLIGSVCGIVVDSSLAVMGALCVPPFTASVYRGLWGLATSLCAELATLVLFAFLIGGTLTAEQGSAAFSWLVTGLGLGLIGTFLTGAVAEPSDPLAPYHYARGLLRQLVDISEGLDSGLDPVALGGS